MDKEIIARGAESIIYKVSEVVIKDRIKKGYRIKELDERIREKRTQLESSLLSKARRVTVPTPVVKKVTKHQIELEYLEGKRLKEYLNEISKEERDKICKVIGEQVAKLHKANLIHGDLTTSNMIWKDNKLYFIDFGLGFHSSSIEDKATDLHLLEEALKSTHFQFWRDALTLILKAYKREYEKADSVLRRLKKIEKRGRYVVR